MRIISILMLSILMLQTQAQQFTKMTDDPIAQKTSDSRSVNIIDLNNDGWEDVFISNGLNGGENNLLFMNDGLDESGKTIFRSIENQAIVTDGGCSYGSNFGDFDNDGDLDLMVFNGFCHSNLRNYVYENQGDGTFVRTLNKFPLLLGLCSYGAAWGDLNNDGFLDIVIANCKNKTADLKPLIQKVFTKQNPRINVSLRDTKRKDHDQNSLWNQ